MAQDINNKNKLFRTAQETSICLSPACDEITDNNTFLCAGLRLIKEEELSLQVMHSTMKG